MAKCDCCGQEASVTYRVVLSKGVKPTRFTTWVLLGMPDNGHPFRQDSTEGWLCAECELLLRQMASFGWLEMTHAQASTQAGHIVTDRKDNRFIGSLEMWT